MPSLFSRLKSGLIKTAQQIRERLGEPAPEPSPDGATARAPALETLEAIEDALISADVGLPATERILQAVREGGSRSLHARVAGEVRRILKDVAAAPETATRPVVVLVVGVNGTRSEERRVG